MSSSSAFVTKAENSHDEGAGDQDKLSFKVVHTPENDDSVVE